MLRGHGHWFSDLRVFGSLVWRNCHSGDVTTRLVGVARSTALLGGFCNVPRESMYGYLLVIPACML